MPDFNRTIFEIPMAEKTLTWKGLTAQTGQSWENFGSIVFMELVDNSLDTAEYADVSPVIEIHLKSDKGMNVIKVPDNGICISPDTIDRILNSQNHTFKKITGVSVAKEESE